MNDTLDALRGKPATVSDAEWEARVDLAAAYRVACYFGWNDTIYNHFSHRVPGEPNSYLVKRHRDMFDEVTASSLIKVRMDGRSLSFDDDVNPAAFAIHTAILGARPEINCTLHMHTPEGIAVSSRPEGFLYMNQEAAFFYDRISEYRYDGIEDSVDEVELLRAALAPHHHTLLMRNHGVAVAGRTVQGALVRMQYFMICAKAQLLATAQSTPPDQLPATLCERTRDQFEGQERGNAFVPEMEAFKRLMDRKLPGFRS